MKRILLTTAAIIAAGISAKADSGTPPGFSGQPNPYGNVDSSQSTYTTTSIGLDSLTLALDVTPHYHAPDATTPPAVNALGGGVYGVSTGTGGDSRSYWNFDFGANSSIGLLTGYNFLLTVVNEANGLSASFDPYAIPDDNRVLLASFGNSESLDFSGSPGFASIGYNPNANDTYDFTLTATAVTGGPVLATDSIKVVAGRGVPDASSTMGLMSFGLVGLGFMSRRFRK